jgi:hypothetical protein
VVSRSRSRVAFNACLRYIHRVRPRDHISHLENSVTGMSLETSAGAQLLTFVYKILHVRHETSILHFFLVSLCPIIYLSRLFLGVLCSVKALPSLGRFISAVRAGARGVMGRSCWVLAVTCIYCIFCFFCVFFAYLIIFESFIDWLISFNIVKPSSRLFLMCVSVICGIWWTVLCLRN